MAVPIHTIPEQQVKLLDRAGGRMNGFQRNVTYETERAIRSAREALRVLLYLWLWQHDEAVHSNDGLDTLLSLCNGKPRDAKVVASARTVLEACRDLHDVPPKHPYDYTKEELHAEIERQAIPYRALATIKEQVENGLGRRLLVKEGDWIRHGHFGVAQIRNIEGCTAELELASPTLFDKPGEPVRVPLLFGEMERIDPAAEALDQGSREAHTYAFEPKDGPQAAEHFQGTHWRPFFPPEELMDRTQAMLSDTQEELGYGDFYHASGKSSISWIPVSLWSHPAGVRHAIFAVAQAPGGIRAIVGGCPYFEHGSQVSLELEKIHVWPGGALAQLDCSWGMARLTFYDTHFGRNRDHYRSGNGYEFILAGIAYEAGRPAINEIEVPEGPSRDALRQARLLSGYTEIDDEATERLSLRGAALLIPLSDGDRDEYEFRGPIRSVEPVTILDVPGWCVETTVMRSLDDDAELVLRIVVSARAWEGDTPPREGEDIEGILWLQGRLGFIPRNTKRPE